MVANGIKYYTYSNLKRFSEESILSFLNNSGVKEPVSRKGYILWKKGNKECFPSDWEKLKEALSDEIENKFNDTAIISISRKHNNLSIKASVPIFLNSTGKNYKINYSEAYETSYIIENFNFDDFIRKAGKVEYISNKCNSNKTCWKTEFSNLEDFKFDGNKDKLFKLEFITSGLEDEVTVKVAIDFEREPNIGEKELKC
jgi:hypothetical protein